MITFGTDKDDLLILLKHHADRLIHDRHSYIDDTAVPTVVIEYMGARRSDLQESIPVEEIAEIAEKTDLALRGAIDHFLDTRKK